MARVIGFIRLSTEEQAAEGRAGLLRQREDIKVAAARYGLEIIRTVELVGVSGTATMEASEFQDVLADLALPDIDGVVCSAQDRLARPDTLGGLAVFDGFLRHAKKIWTPGSVIDLREDSGFLMTGIFGLMAGIERKQILRRVQTAKEEQRKRGRCPNAKITLPRAVDFDFATGKWSWKQPEAALVKRSFELLLEGRSVRSIAKELGFCTPRGMGIMLRNPIWIGVREYTQKRGEKYPSRNGRQVDRKKVRREEPLTVKIDLEPLITRAEWDAAQDLLRTARKGWRSSRSEISPFESSGFLYCSCGERMYSKSDRRKGKHDYYYCRSQHPKGAGCGAKKPRRELMDYTVAGFVRDCLLQPEVLALILDAPQGLQPGTRADVGSSEKEHEQRLEAERQRLTRLVLKGLIGETEFEREAKRIESELQGIRHLLDRHRSHLSADLDPRQTATLIAHLLAELEFADPAARRSLLRKMLSKVEVSDGAITKAVLRIPATVSNIGTRTGTGSSQPQA